MRFSTLLRGLALAALVGSSLPGRAGAQSWTSSTSERGWIGISFQVDEDRWGRTSAVTITDVSPGSPAHDAGLRPGDRLMAINELDSPAELAELSERLRLSVGDRVVMEVERAGERRRLRLSAVERPEAVDFGRRVEVAFAEEGQVESWVRSMDSLRIELAQGQRQNFRIRSTTGEGSARVTVVNETNGRSVQAPFEFFVFRGEGHDSLKQEMVELNRAMQELEHQLERRERQIRVEVRSADPVHLAEDDEFRVLSGQLDAVSERSVRLRAAMAEAARETAGLEYVGRAPRVSTVRVGSAGIADEPPAPAEFRPLTPYLLGRNRVAGAEVVDLKPELAAYFEVEGGVLVVDVAPGTPAGMAGIVPGDVIVRIDRVSIRSIDDLRFGVSMAGDSLPVTLIRQGQTAQVLLRR